MEVVANLRGVTLEGTASSADLGGSSKYSSETLEDRRGGEQRASREVASLER